MKLAIKIFLSLFIGIHSCVSQEASVTLSAKMFGNRADILLSPLDGWIFKEGSDTSWANEELNTNDWTKLKPTDLSPEYADYTGRVEGWFRLKLKLDESFTNVPVGFSRSGWAATDLYVDGSLLYSFGNTGIKGKSFHEFNPIDKPALAVTLEPGKEHLIALHFVDYLTLIPPHELKTVIEASARPIFIGLDNLIRLTGPNYNSILDQNSRRNLKHRTMWLSITALLAMLFWLLVFQNRREKKILVLIAIYGSLSVLSNLARFFFTDPNSSFIIFRTADLLMKISFWIDLIITFIIVTTILKFRVAGTIKSWLIVFSILGGFLVFFNFFISFFYLINTLGWSTYAYIAISSPKKTKGAQWAIVIGLSLSSLFASILGLLLTKSYLGGYMTYLLTGFYLSFPVALLVYVSLRFREIISEVQENARQVVRLSEEKKEQAINQQRILQEEVNKQTAELRSTLDNLKATQSQLIQSEKMASLGELTAGIAHEIQNPLNFVNNFSDVNTELVDEACQEIEKGNIADVKTILSDLRDNEQKINHHGKRADAIVKGMLQHSRASSGKKELTEINALCDEYLRMVYHGMRAKDKSLTVKCETDFDHTIGKINIVFRDVGRALLNLINNAFYVVNEKAQRNIPEYEPTVIISTKRLDGKVEIGVRDNGNGIPQKIVDKIFQPFFTTKPTGQGTGLGLSLAYDIVKAHGGDIKVETKEGEGSEFIVQLPLQ